MTQEIRKEVLKLMDEKDKIENEIKELTSILTQNGIGMNEPLVDAEGYPINSIDIYQVRDARQKIICLQNDHKSLMKKIENGLHGYYSETSSRPAATSKDSSVPNKTIHEIPFAKITLVDAQSPADLAGLQKGDLVVEFGSVNSTNFKNITDIASVVQHSENIPVLIKVKRTDKFVSNNLIPKKWLGKGLLGCKIESL